MALDLANLSDEALLFLQERHLATLATLRPDNTIHVVPVGFTYDVDSRLARVITFAASHKARYLADGGRAAICQVEGARWLTLEGEAVVTNDADRVDEAVRRYTERYRQPSEREDRVAVEIRVDRAMGRV